MLNLMKYEFLRRKKLMLILLVSLVLAEALVLLGINQGGRLGVVAVIVIFVMIFGSIILIFADSIRTYSSDLNKKEGYLLFMTPNSGHKIIGSKMIVNFLVLILTFVIVFFMMYLNFQYTKALYFTEVDGILQEMITGLGEIFGDAIPGLAALFFIAGTWLLEIFGYIMVAIFALTMRKTIFAQTRYGGLLSFVIFIIVIITMQTVNTIIFTTMSFFTDYIDNVVSISAGQEPDPSIFIDLIRNAILMSVGLWVIYIGAFFGISGRLLGKRVDL